VTTYDWLLFFHLLFVLVFFSGGVVATVLQVAALRRERPGEIVVLLRLIRVAVPLVMAGALGALVFGMLLVSHVNGYDMGKPWISASVALWLASVVLGGLGGRKGRHARELAERLAAQGAATTPELRALVAHRSSLLMSYASGALLLVILFLMVWKPG
jgi:uncharacterized membrane protein